MRNLFERLKTEHIEKLKEEEIKYPLSVKNLQNELSNANHWVGLKYSSIINLATYLNTYNYSPTAINNLFEND